MSIIKTFLLTCFLIMVLQIRLENRTLEDRLHKWLQSSQVTDYLREVAEGATVLAQDLLGRAKNEIQDSFKEKSSHSKAEQANR